MHPTKTRLILPPFGFAVHELLLAGAYRRRGMGPNPNRSGSKDLLQGPQPAGLSGLAAATLASVK